MSGLAALVAGLITCTPLDTRGPCGLTRQLLDVEGQMGLLLLPPGLEPGEKAPLVIYHHGRGEAWNAIESRSTTLTLTCALGASGYMVAGTHAHGDNWGRGEAVDDYVALYEVVDAEHPVEEVMYLSVSMGGLTGLLSLARGTIPDVRAWAGIFPVTNLGYTFFDDDQYREQIGEVYGLAPAPEQDPMLMDPAAFRGIPMLIWASYGDTSVPTEHNSALFLERLDYPDTARLIVTEGDHGDRSNYDPTELVAFFDEHREQRRTR